MIVAFPSELSFLGGEPELSGSHFTLMYGATSRALQEI
jgi:hypothetical protein